MADSRMEKCVILVLDTDEAFALATVLSCVAGTADTPRVYIDAISEALAEVGFDWSQSPFRDNISGDVNFRK